jgi:hypothetical protein
MASKFVVLVIRLGYGVQRPYDREAITNEGDTQPWQSLP